MVEFRECPFCWGYGIKDSGATCKKCGGSGELMYDKETGRPITRRELIKRSKALEKKRVMEEERDYVFKGLGWR